MPIYIDPTSPTNGVGTTADPKNTWDGLTLVVNEKYRQKRGTTCYLPTGTSKYIHANILASNPATPLTLEAYYYSDGSDEPSLPRPEIVSDITSNGVGTILIRKSSNVLIQNLKLRAVIKSAYLIGGIRIYAQNAGVYTGVTIRNCEIVDHPYGVWSVLSTTDAGTECNDILIEDNEIHDNTAGIQFAFYTPLNSYFKRTTIRGNRIYNNGQRTTVGVVPQGISFNYGSGVANDNTRSWKDVLIYDNDIYNNEGYPLAVRSVFNETLQSRIYNNRVHDNNKTELYDSHGIFAAYCFGTIVERNTVTGNSGYAVGPFGTACGIIIDTDVGSGIGGDGVIVRNNIIDGGWVNYNFGGGGSEAVNAQAGIFVIDNSNCTIEGNLIRGFHSGIGTYATTGGTPLTKLNGLVIRNNVIADLLESSSTKTAVGISLRSGMTTLIENNILSNCRQGIWAVNTLTLPTERNNCIFAPRNGVYFAQSATIDVTTPTVALNGSDTIADPLLDANLFISSATSPAYRTGNHAGYKADCLGSQRWNPPSLGAYEYVEARPSRLT